MAVDKRRALVTGATGFIGNALVTELRRRGWAVVAVTRRPVGLSDPGVTCLAGDLERPESLDLDAAGVGPVQAVFHLAARMPTHLPPADVATYLTANAVATARFLGSKVAREATSFVYASGLTVIGKPETLPVAEDHPTRPLHPYLLSKLCGELACELVRRTEGRRVTSLRITSPYGSGMPPTSVLPRFVRQALDSEDLSWFGSGGRTQNFVHVADVVRALLLASETPSPGVYNLAGPASVSMKDLARMIVRLAQGSQSRAVPSGSPDPQDDFRWEIDLRGAEAGLGYRPEVTLERGIGELIASTRTSAAPARWWSVP